MKASVISSAFFAMILSSQNVFADSLAPVEYNDLIPVSSVTCFLEGSDTPFITSMRVGRWGEPKSMVLNVDNGRRRIEFIVSDIISNKHGAEIIAYHDDLSRMNLTFANLGDKEEQSAKFVTSLANLDLTCEIILGK